MRSFLCRAIRARDNQEHMRLVVVLSLCGSVLSAQTNPSLDDVIREIRGAYQSEQAMRIMREVYANDRFFTFPRFHVTSEYLEKQMRQMGLQDVELVDAPADGV